MIAYCIAFFCVGLLLWSCTGGTDCPHKDCPRTPNKKKKGQECPGAPCREQRTTAKHNARRRIFKHGTTTTI